MRVIKRSRIPTYIPVSLPIVTWLLLDRLQAPGWVYGVVFTVAAILIAGCIVKIFKDEEVDIFEEDKDA